MGKEKAVRGSNRPEGRGLPGKMTDDSGKSKAEQARRREANGFTEQPGFTEGGVKVLLASVMYFLTKTIKKTRTRTEHSFLKMNHKSDIYMSSIF